MKLFNKDLKALKASKSKDKLDARNARDRNEDNEMWEDTPEGALIVMLALALLAALFLWAVLGFFGINLWESLASLAAFAIAIA